MTLLWNLHLAACAGMTSVIWIVQLLIYPGFSFVEAPHFLAMHKRHTTNITWVVGPLMLVELSTGVLLVVQQPTAFYIANLFSIFFLWGLTAFVSVPLHDRLSKNSKCSETIQKLVSTNWPRTIIWSLRFIGLWVYQGAFL